MNVLDQVITDRYIAYHGDCCEVVKALPDASIHYSVFSPPFASLYTYSNSERDLGNCRTHSEFYEHFRYLVPELLRVTKSGRLLSFHCMNIPTSKARDGVIGITDFRGLLIRMFEEAGWIYHSEVCIWKDPVTAMQRTKALGLLHKQIKKDSCMSRQGIPDYLVTMRKPGQNPEPVTHTDESFPVKLWQEYASPIWTDKDFPRDDWIKEVSLIRAPDGSFVVPFDAWMDINPSDTLQFRSAREHADERHICPLQLEVIRRGLRRSRRRPPRCTRGAQGHLLRPALPQPRRRTIEGKATRSFLTRRCHLKLTVSRETLLAALGHCAAVVDRKTSYFAASAVLLETVAGRMLTLRATDCVAASIRITVPDVEHEGPASVAVSARAMQERVKAMPDGAKVTLVNSDAGKASLVITGKGSRRFTLRTFPASEMPAWSKCEGPPVAIPGKAIASALGMVEHAMRTDVEPAAQHAAMLSYDGAFVRADATDAKQSALADVSVPSSSASMGVLLGFRTVGVVRKLCEASESVNVTRAGDAALFVAGNVEFCTLSVAAQFPPLRQIVFSDAMLVGASVEVARDAFAEALRGIALAGGHVTMSIAGEMLALKSFGNSTGEEASDTIPAVVKGKAEPNNFVCSQLLSAMAAAPEANIVIEMMASSTHPLRIKSGAATFVLMPVIL